MRTAYQRGRARASKGVQFLSKRVRIRSKTSPIGHPYFYPVRRPASPADEDFYPAGEDFYACRRQASPISPMDESKVRQPTALATPWIAEERQSKYKILAEEDQRDQRDQRGLRDQRDRDQPAAIPA